MSAALEIFVLVSVSLTTMVRGFPNFEKPNEDESFQTVLEKWSVYKKFTENGEASFESSDNEREKVTCPPQLPSTFQTTIFHTVGNTVAEAVRVSFDYPNQRFAAYGFKNGNSTASKIVLCNAHMQCIFNATSCQCFRNVLCNISRTWLPPFARFSASFTLGQSARGVPVYQWTIGSRPETAIVVLTQLYTGAPVQVVQQGVAGLDIQDFTNLQLNVDPRQFYIPPQCKKFDVDSSESSSSFKDHANIKL